MTTQSAAAAAQAQTNAAMLPGAQAIQQALEAMDTALATAAAVFEGCSDCRPVQLFNNVTAFRQSYGVEAASVVAMLTPPAIPPAPGS